MRSNNDSLVVKKPKKEMLRMLIFCLIFYVFLCLFDLCLISKADDCNFEDGLANFGSLWNWMVFWANNWSGRVFPQGALVWLAQYPEAVFHLVNSAMWLILLLYAMRNLDPEGVLDRKEGMILLYGSIFILLPASVLDDSVYWKCANVCYLWGIAALMVAIYPLTTRLAGKRYTRKDIVAAVIAVIFSAGFEQSGALMSGIMVCLVIALRIREKKVDAAVVGLMALSCVATAFFLSLPGNAARTSAETIIQMPNYDMYSFLDRFLWGIDYAISHIYREAPELPIIIALLNLCYVVHRKQKNITQALIVFATVMYWGLDYFNTLSSRLQEGSTYLSPLFSLVGINTTDFGVSKTNMFAEILAVGMVVMLGMSTAMLADGFDVLCWGMFFGGLATMLIMGFSPTMIASAERPRFVGYFCLICCIFACIIRNRSLKETTKGTDNAEEGQ